MREDLFAAVKAIPTVDVFRAYFPERELWQDGGNRWKALCLFHTENDPSLTIFSDGFKCFGCGACGSNIDLLLKAGIADSPMDAAKRIAERFGLQVETAHEWRQIGATYLYHDESGTPLYEVVRFSPKGFAQRRPDGNGGWVWKLDGIRKVLYRLPEVLKAKELIVVEGEKDADALCQLSFVATTNPGGAGKWRPEYSEALKDKDIVVFPDNDAEGHAHAAQVAASVFAVARSVKVVQLPDLPPKGDVSDWLAAGGDADALATIIENAEPYQPDFPPAFETDFSTATEKPGLDVISATDLLAMEFPDTPPIIAAGILPPKGKALLSAWGGVGKSVLLLQVGIELALGQDVLDRFPVPAPRRLFAILQEDPLEETQKRLRLMLARKGHGPEDLDGFFLNVPSRYVRLTSAGDTEAIIAQLKTLKADVLILDPLITFHTENENDNARMRMVMDRITAIQEATGCAVIVSHHDRKTLEDNDLDPARGARSIQDWARTVINLTPRSVEGEQHLIRLTFKKLNYGPIFPRPLTLERDSQTLLCRVMEETVLCSPERAKEILVDMGGTAERMKDWHERIVTATGCSRRTAAEAAKRAIELNLVKKERRPGMGGPARVWIQTE